MIATIFGTVAELVGGWVGRKNRIAEAKANAEIENAGKVIDNAGWKDEFVVLVWSAPALMAFVPGMHEYAQVGFENLASAPEWYIVGWVSISMAIYGIKPATKSLIKWRERKTGEKSD